MVFKVLFMSVLDVSSTGQRCMVMNLQLNPSIKNQGCCHHYVVVHERRVQNQVKRAQTRKNPASMWTILYQYLVWRTLRRGWKVKSSCFLFLQCLCYLLKISFHIVKSSSQQNMYFGAVIGWYIIKIVRFLF